MSEQTALYRIDRHGRVRLRVTFNGRFGVVSDEDSTAIVATHNGTEQFMYCNRPTLIVYQFQWRPWRWNLLGALRELFFHKVVAREQYDPYGN